MKKKIILLLVFFPLALPLRAGGLEFGKLTEIEFWQRLFGWEQGAAWTENLFHVTESLLTMDEQLQNLREGTGYTRALYNVGQLLEEPIIPEIISLTSEVYSMMQGVTYAVREATMNGEFTLTKAKTVIQSLIYPELLLTECIGMITIIIGKEGMTWVDKRDELEKLLQKVRYTQAIVQRLYDDAVVKARKEEADKQRKNFTLSSVGLPTFSSSTNFSGPTDAYMLPVGATNANNSDIDDIVSAAHKIASNRVSLAKTKEELGKARKPALDIATIIIGIMALFTLIGAFARRNKGEHQNADALYKVFAGMLFAVLALQLVQAIIMNLTT